MQNLICNRDQREIHRDKCLGFKAHLEIKVLKIRFAKGKHLVYPRDECKVPLCLLKISSLNLTGNRKHLRILGMSVLPLGSANELLESEETPGVPQG